MGSSLSPTRRPISGEWQAIYTHPIQSTAHQKQIIYSFPGKRIPSLLSIAIVKSRRSLMASVERAMAKAAAGLLPGLLPTPPRSTITTPRLIILPSSFAFKPKPGRADSVQRWDAHKKDTKPGSPSSSSCGSSSPGSASSCERWDMNMTMSRSSSSSSSSVASSCERWESNKRATCGHWDIHKKCGSSSSTSSSSSSSSSRGSSAIPGRASSADRWDTHKKARSGRTDAESRTGEQEEMEIDYKHSQENETMAMVPTAPRMDLVFSGSGFFASPEPSMLPMPAFFRSRCPSMMPVPAH
uniref:Uncharacterized protein n=1 Tax=Avena sativa TaxID=4498 RepID=A0ACD5XPP7_AVESA